jgi:hypothetical protein
MITPPRLWPALLLALLGAGACANAPSHEPAGLGTVSAGGTAGTSGGTAGTSGGTAGASAAGGTPASGGVGGTTSVGGSPRIDVDASPGDDAGDADVCATVSATAELEPVYLAFAFDVSGSMGKGDYPWHDATLKWDPVVAATRGFFEDDASKGLTASLTVFPIDASDDDRCDSASYVEPLIGMTDLPSTELGAALDAIREENWRGGTPTLAVVEGVQRFIAEYREDHPGHYVFVLVTDGYPQDCDDDSIASVEDAVRSAAAEIPTYVIGVKNPPLTDDDGKAAPDTVSNLAGVAEAGGTKTAFIIDTGDPSSTTATFLAAVDAIRGQSIACNMPVPSPPDGRSFRKDSVIVTYTSGSVESSLTYDAACALDDGWHYDDVGAPTEVILCPKACATVQADAKAELAVGFTCAPVIEFPR